MIVTLFGGTGFIGRHVVQRLARRGCQIRLVTRDPDAVRRLQGLGQLGQIVRVPSRLGDDAALQAAVAGADWVVNLIGILAERRSGDFARLQGALPGRIGRAAAAAGVSRLVHVSAIGAAGDSPSAYGRSKAAGEAALRAAFPAATILRPSIVFGTEDGFFNRFGGLAARLPVMPVIAGETRFQPVYVGDVADAVLAALTRADAPGRIYELGGPEVASFRDWLARVLDWTGRRRRLVTVPPGLARLQARLGEWLPNPPLTRDQLAMLARDNVVAPDASGLAALGVAPTPAGLVVPGYLKRFRPPGREV